ncbi:MAG: hypothetical protein NZ959_02420 [Armatimonadetes bacterium]|nr:hypothetical protein [Armatimonadota bacterium]MDW8120973.1 acyl-CoA reductase [Armatimonadota bacterium]
MSRKISLTDKEPFVCWCSPIPLKHVPNDRGFLLPQLTPNDLQEVIRRLRQGSRLLQATPVATILQLIDQWARHLERSVSALDSPLVRQLAVRMSLPEIAVRQILHHQFRSLTADALWQLLEEIIGDPSVLDEGPIGTQQRIRAKGPDLTLLILPSNVPGVGIWDLVFCLLCKSAVLLKPSVREPFLIVIAAQSLCATDPVFATSVAALPWSADGEELTALALRNVDAVVAYGNELTQDFVQKNTPPSVHLIKRGPKFSIALIGKSAVSPITASLLARDLVLLDQRGCLSPAVCFIEGADGAERLSLLLTDALRSFNNDYPVALTVSYRSAVGQLRLSALAAGARVLGSPADGWLVIVWNETTPFWSDLLTTVRALHIVPVQRLEDVIELLKGFKGKIQAAALATEFEHAQRLAIALAHLGISRICSVGNLQFPPLTWEQDGRHLIRELVGWCQVEPLAITKADGGWVEVFRGPDQQTHLIRSLLESQGIPSTITYTSSQASYGEVEAVLLVPPFATGEAWSLVQEEFAEMTGRQEEMGKAEAT